MKIAFPRCEKARVALGIHHENRLIDRKDFAFLSQEALTLGKVTGKLQRTEEDGLFFH